MNTDNSHHRYDVMLLINGVRSTGRIGAIIRTVWNRYGTNEWCSSSMNAIVLSSATTIRR
jgi:hypothetical protein